MHENSRNQTCQVLKKLAGLCLLACFFGCANPVPPEGGPRDTQPPVLDSLQSTRNFQTRFKKQDIELAWDEWVQLADVFTQVVVSPPLEFRPDIKLKKKTVVLAFDEREVLRDSATYVVNFGQAIKDLTEGNAAPVVFVFSTGDYIDSLSASGRVADAFTGEPVEKALFMLYENLADSVVRKERPFYFALTDKQGNFQVQNIKAGTFKAAALLDQNLNYRFDGEAEKIAFLDSALTVGAASPRDTAEARDTLAQAPADTLQVKRRPPPSSRDKPSAVSRSPSTVPAMRLFEEEKPLFLRGKEAGGYGVAKLAFSGDPSGASVAFDSVGQQVFLEKERDTLRLWYALPADTSWNIYVRRDTLTDTVRVKSGLREVFFKTAALKAPSAKPGAPERQHPEQPFRLAFNHPLASFDASKITLLEDTARVAVQPNLEIDSSAPEGSGQARRSLLTKFAWKEGLSYELQVLPGGVADIFGLVNADTVRRSFTAALRKDFGTLTVKLKNLRPDTAYVLRVLVTEGLPPAATFRVIGQDSFQATLPMLVPAAYTLELIEDLDRNGRWTTGNYDLHRQPERLTRKTLEPLRANWELEAEMEARFDTAQKASKSAGSQPDERRGGWLPDRRGGG